MTTADLDQMTPQQLTASLMRGNRAEGKRGYAADSAALAALSYKHLPPEAMPRLQAYARGFANGIAEAIEGSDAATRFGRYSEPEPGSPERVLFSEGLGDGRQENGFLLLPTLPVGEEVPGL